MFCSLCDDDDDDDDDDRLLSSPQLPQQVLELRYGSAGSAPSTKEDVNYNTRALFIQPHHASAECAKKILEAPV